MKGTGTRRRAWLGICGAVLLLASVGAPAGALQRIGGLSAPRPLFGTVNATASFGPGLSGRVHRAMTRAQHSANRLVAVGRQVGLLWLWMLLSAAVCLMIAAFASVADVRMFELRREGPGALSRYLAHGIRTFFRIVRDRRTPNLARLVLLAALLYWLLPSDLIADNTVLPGFLDDFVVVVVAAKTFMYLCPDSLVARHAEAVEAKA